MKIDPNFRKFLKFVISSHRRVTIVIVTLLVVGGVVEAISVLALFPMVAAFLNTVQWEQSQITSMMPVVFFGHTMSLIQLTTIVLIGVFAKGVFSYISMRRIGETVAEIVTGLRMNFLKHLFCARQHIFVDMGSGVFQSNLGVDSLDAANAYEFMCEFFSRLMQTILYLAIVFYVSPEIGLVSVLVGFAVFTISRRFFLIARISGQLRVSKMRNFTSKLLDTLYVLKVIKAMSREKSFLIAIGNNAEEVKASLLQHTRSTAGLSAIQEPILVLGILFCLFFATQYARIDPATIAVLGFVFLRVAVQLRLALLAYQQLANKVAAYSGIEENIMLLAGQREFLPGTSKVDNPISMEFRDVSFGYDRKRVVERVSIKMPANSLTVLIGPSGSGKTTILDLCAGLVPPSEGSIFINNQPIENLDIPLWRRKLGYVQQASSLIHGTIIENLTLGDEEISEDDVQWALRTAVADQFVLTLVDGVATNVGEHGNRLSSGQRQRIGFARAIIHNPDVLLLDEITGTLDTKASQKLISSLLELKLNKTIVVATHQQDLIAVADYHYWVDRGDVVKLTREMALEKSTFI